MTNLIVSLYIALTATAEPRPNIDVLDLAYLNKIDLHDAAAAKEAWDTLHLAASAQGIVNRDAPRLFLRFMPQPDDFWFDYITAGDGWLADHNVTHLEDIEDFLHNVSGMLKGVVVYDPGVPATSNLASTIAGIEDRICLRYDPDPSSLYTRVMTSGHEFTQDTLYLINKDGTPFFTGEGNIPGTDTASTGSAKCDAYYWAKARYLDSGRCSSEYLGFYIDSYWLHDPTVAALPNCTLTNHDFLIANRAFFFDLHVWPEEAPVDDPAQPPGTDVQTLKAILQSMQEHASGNVFQISGFTPWIWKYTNEGNAGGKHGGVDTEWELVRIASKYGAYLDADALGLGGMANASFYQHFPLQDHYPQNSPPEDGELKERGYLTETGAVTPKTYICFYMGDYDSAAWLNTHVPKWWRDPARGTIPCAWPFNPNLDKRAPHVFDYVRSRQSPNDWFIFGDSGAGYLNPGGLNDSLRAAWTRHNLAYAKKYDLSILGFVIDGHSPGMGDPGLDAYAQFTPDGLVGQKVPAAALHNGAMPVTQMRMDLHGSPEVAAKRLAALATPGAATFHFIRTILKSPTWHKSTMDAARTLEPNIEFVDPYTFFRLFARSI